MPRDVTRDRPRSYSDNRLKAMTNEELVRLVASGHPQSSGAERILVDRNHRLVRQVSLRYGGPDIDHEDLLTVGVIGFLTAIRKFDPSRGVKLSTYAVPWIRQAIGRYVETSGTIRLPAHTATNIAKLRQARKTLGEGADIEALASEMGLSPAQVELTMQAERMRFVGELDAPVKTGSSKQEECSALGDLLSLSEPSPEEIVLAGMAGEVLNNLIDSLPERSAEILRRRAAGETLAMISEDMEISRERCRQIEVETIRGLKTRTRSVKHLFV